MPHGYTLSYTKPVYLGLALYYVSDIRQSVYSGLGYSSVYMATCGIFVVQTGFKS